MPAILSPVSRTLKFGVNPATRQTEPYFCPAGSEITTTIAAVNGIVQGAASIDYTVSSPSLVQAGTAVWVSAALTYNTAGIFVQKVYDDCYVRANVTGGTVAFYINPAGSSITPTYNPFLQFTQGPAPSPGPPPSAPFTIAATPGNAVDNSASWASQVAEGGSLISQTTTARIAAPGTYLFNSLNDVFPSFSPVFFARGPIILSAGANLPAVTSAPGPGAPAAVLRNLRRTDPNPDVLAYETMFQGFYIDGTGSTQSNFVSGIRVPGPNPANNPFDPDPSFTTNKDYVAGAFYNINIQSPSGHGITVEGGNGRFDYMSSSTLGCGGNGLDLGGNDIVLHGHWDSGSNAGWSLKLGKAAGCYAVTGNVWSNPATRCINAGSMWVQQRRYWIIGITEFNDWSRVDGGTNYDAPGGFVGCMFHPHSVNFASDGVGINALGDGDTRLNCNVGWQEFQGVGAFWNFHARTDNGSLATPGNFGGALDGSFGTAPQQLHNAVTSGAQPLLLNVAEAYSTAPNVKPWTSLQQTATAAVGDPGVITSAAHGLKTNSLVGFYTTGVAPGGLTVTTQPYYVLVLSANTFNISLTPFWNGTQGNSIAAGGSCIALTTTGSGTLTFVNMSTAPYSQAHQNLLNYQYMDSYRGLFRVGTLCASIAPPSNMPLLAQHSHIALGIAEAADINPHYYVEIGDAGDSNARTLMYGNTELAASVQYSDNAWGSSSVTNAMVKAIPSYEPVHFFTVAGGGIASATINFNTGLNSTYSGTIIFVGGPITALSWGIASGGGSINSAGIQPPTTNPGDGLTVQYTYRRDTNDIRITQVSGGVASVPVGRVDGKQVEAGLLGDTTQRVNQAVSGTALTTATPANLAQVTLTPGTYLNFGYASFTATTAVVTSVQYGLTETSATIPGVKDESYGAQQYGTAGLSMNAIFQTGVVMQRLAVSTATTVYLVGQANFASGTVSSGGSILPIRIG